MPPCGDPQCGPVKVCGMARQALVTQMTKGHLGGPVEFGLRRTVRRLDGKTSYDRRQIPCVVIDVDFLRQLSALSCFEKALL